MRNIVSPLDGFLSPFGRRFGAVIDPFTSLMSTLLSGSSQLIAHPLEYGSMFQDRAGTTPVTEPGQLVGMVLDHGFTGSKPVAGPELVTNGDFSDGATGWTLTQSEVVDGSLVYTPTTSSAIFVSQPGGAYQVGKSYALEYEVISNTIPSFSLRINFGGGDIRSLPQTVGAQSVKLINVGGTRNVQFETFVNTIDGSFIIDNISIRELPGYHATAISDAARGVFREVDGIRWVEYNGVNTAYSTPALIGVSVDKAQLFAGVRKLSDASLGVIGSLASSPSVTGSLTLDSRRYASGDYAMTIRNPSTNSVQNFVTYNAPITNVLSAIYNQSGVNIDEELSLRVDGVLSAKGGVSLYNAGSANFASAPIYLGAQGGTSAFFNGRSYATLGPITRFSATNATAAQIEAAEAYYTARVI